MKVLIIGSGPILIGQAAEFDYAGTQACRALREEGVRTILVNSNPATIMTDPGVADVTYLEPLVPEVLERIIAKERPDALLPTLGGQTGLNLAVALHDSGVLERHGVRILGTPIRSIKQAEDREAFKRLLIEIGEPVPESTTAESVDAALAFAATTGYPLVIRPAYTLGGTGGGFARDQGELIARVTYGIAASPIGQVLVERSLVGWKEVEYEVMRDAGDACITVCNMENIDPMGVHTGDSIVVAPSQTLSDREYQQLRSASFRIIRALGIEGGCNVQFALHPDRTPADHTDGRVPYYVIEVNPRVSRSSALASKATGYPIARVAAKIAIGKRLHEIPNAVTKRTTAAFEPALDYVVVKIPRWPFDKFPAADRSIGTQMKATGEVMAIDRTFEASLLKAMRSLEIKGQGLFWESPRWASIRDGGEFIERSLAGAPTDDRLWRVFAALRRGADVERVHEATRIDRWFLERFRAVVRSADEMQGKTPTPGLLRRAKRTGFSDADIGTLTGLLAADVRRLREQWGILPVYKMVDTCAAEFEALTPYFYSTYEQENEATALPGPKAIVLGSGPIRIGQGIEFDCCCVQAAGSLAAGEVASIMVNSNPETVSTDFDASARLYFEPLDEESVAEVIRNERTRQGAPPPADPLAALQTPRQPPSSPDPQAVPVFVQFGGQTALNLAERIEAIGGVVAGTSADAIGLAEDRRRFHELADALGIPQPAGGTADSLADAAAIAERVGYPVLVRPSYVLGGRGMEIAYSADDLERYFASALEAGTGRVLVDKYLRGREVEVDAVSDGTDTLVAGIMEHVERAGVHSGDSFAVYPAQNLSAGEKSEIVALTRRIASALPVRGLLNIQFIVEERSRGAAPPSDPPPLLSAPSDPPPVLSALSAPPRIYVLEVNPRASRTVPFLTKVTGVPLVRLAVEVALGSTLRAEGYARDDGLWPEDSLVAVKAPVFSMAKLLDVDTFLGPEMKSTGEVMGIDRSFAPALWKSLVAAGMAPPASGKVLVTVADKDKPEAAAIIEGLHWLGYEIVATSGTARLARSLGAEVTEVPKLAEGDQTILQIIRSGQCAAVINTPTLGKTVDRDGFLIRRAAVEARVPCLTSLDTALAVVTALRASVLTYDVAPLSAYRAGATTGTAQAPSSQGTAVAGPDRPRSPAPPSTPVASAD